MPTVALAGEVRSRPGLVFCRCTRMGRSSTRSRVISAIGTAKLLALAWRIAYLGPTDRSLPATVRVFSSRSFISFKKEEEKIELYILL